MSDAQLRAALLRTLTWYETLGYAPTHVELAQTLGIGLLPPGASLALSSPLVASALSDLFASGTLIQKNARVYFADTVDQLAPELASRDLFQPRKRRRAWWVTRWLACVPGVRFVALANTTALGYARDEGDLDFFVVVRAGSLWITRLLAGLPFRLLRLTPRDGYERDAICLSYFVADDVLDLTSHQLTPDDPYFRYWFLSLLPLYDDGVSLDLWKANTKVLAQHPFARPWIAPPDLRVTSFRDRHAWWQNVSMTLTRPFEPLARSIQSRWFPHQMKERMNRDTTVMISDHVLKFHVTDTRAEYREKYLAACKRRNIDV